MQFELDILDKGPTSEDLWKLIPQNRRRSVNKIINPGTYFNLEYNVHTNKLAIKKHDNVVFSTIPYDTSYKYVQEAAILTMLDAKSVEYYLRLHEQNLKVYITKALEQIHKPTNLCNHYYDEIFKHRYFMIQVAGRMLQHDEGWPLTAMLPAKFLYDINITTGIPGYISEFLKFIVSTNRDFPIITDGFNVTWVGLDDKPIAIPTTFVMRSIGNTNSDVLLNVGTITNVDNSIGVNSYNQDINKPLLVNEMSADWKNIRKNYKSQSFRSDEWDAMFENVLPTINNNQINVVSDVHSRNGKLPLSNQNFNIMAGDLSDSLAVDKDIHGIIVIGNHELSDIVSSKQTDSSYDYNPDMIELRKKDETLFSKFQHEPWFKALERNPSESWPMLPLGNAEFYKFIQKNIQKRFPNMIVLNNESIVHNGIRYIGLTIPVSLKKRKRSVQEYVYTELNKLLENDRNMPTIIVSHAPLFNELSMLSPQSTSYDSDSNCVVNGIVDIFAEFNIIGVIHGHHHIPASHGIFRETMFGNRKLFIVCSIYSKVNIGFELQNLIDKYTDVNLQIESSDTKEK